MQNYILKGWTENSEMIGAANGQSMTLFHKWSFGRNINMDILVELATFSISSKLLSK